MKFKTIIISDLHLGMPEANPDKLLDFLTNNPCESLIINGDLIDGFYLKIFGNWKDKFDDFFNNLDKITKKNHTKIFYIQGNHEVFIKNIVAFKNIKITNDMIYTSFGKKYYIIHGHQFDFANRRLGILSYIAFLGGNLTHLINRIYNFIRIRLGMKPLSLIRPMKKLAHIIIGGNKKFKNKLYAKMKEKKCQAIIYAHTHKAENTKIGNIHYLNSGDWMESCSALGEDQKGNRKIVYHKE